MSGRGSTSPGMDGEPILHAHTEEVGEPTDTCCLSPLTVNLGLNSDSRNLPAEALGTDPCSAGVPYWRELRLPWPGILSAVVTRVPVLASGDIAHFELDIQEVFGQGTQRPKQETPSAVKCSVGSLSFYSRRK